MNKTINIYKDLKKLKLYNGRYNIWTGICANSKTKKRYKYFLEI